MSGPLRATTERSHNAQDQELLRRSLVILGSYLLAMLGPMVAWTLRSQDATGLALHVAAIVLVALAFAGRLPTTLRYWSPLVLGPFLYIELRWLIPGAGRHHVDASIVSWERALFSSDPSSNLAHEWHIRALSELLHASYLSYYALVFLPPIALWMTRRRTQFEQTLLALAVVYALCFSIYVLFPVDGPRFLHGPASAPDGPIRAIVVALLESGSSRGTAFPSSHVAASVVATVCALRFQRPLGVAVALLTAGICVAAVYGGYHYAIDIVAGLATGVVAVLIALALEGRVGETSSGKYASERGI